GYRILRGGGQVGTSTTTSFTDTGLQPSTGYGYQVVAFDASGNESTPASLTATTLADTAPPSQPQGVTVSGATVTSLTVSWTASTHSAADPGYRVLRGGTQVGTSTTTSFVDTGLQPATSYGYTVVAFDA